MQKFLPSTHVCPLRIPLALLDAELAKSPRLVRNCTSKDGFVAIRTGKTIEFLAAENAI